MIERRISTSRTNLPTLSCIWDFQKRSRPSPLGYACTTQGSWGFWTEKHMLKNELLESEVAVHSEHNHPRKSDQHVLPSPRNQELFFPQPQKPMPTMRAHRPLPSASKENEFPLVFVILLPAKLGGKDW